MESISSNYQLIEPKCAFSVGLGTTGSFGCGSWKLGDATYFGWPNQAFKVLDMRENV